MSILHFLLTAVAVCCSASGTAQSIVYEKTDSVKVMQLLAEAASGKTTADYMGFFGSRLKGTPYVAKTLEVGRKENLIINLRELDCTTFTETVLALSLCMKNNKRTFMDFANYLRLIRYDGGHISYDRRLHYFTSWIDNNTRNGFVDEGSQDILPKTLFNGVQTLNINYMTTHASQYPRLVGDSAMTDKIRNTEKALTGRTFRYIPKTMLRHHATLRKHVRNGDIIVILTSKRGLDTSHIGIASWHKDGTLHLMNASQIHKKVVDEPMTIYNYMRKHPSQIGIRVIKPL